MTLFSFVGGIYIFLLSGLESRVTPDVLATAIERGQTWLEEMKANDFSEVITPPPKVTSFMDSRADQFFFKSRESRVGDNI